MASDATIDSDAQRREDASLAPDDGVQADTAPGTQTDTDTGAADANEPDATAGRDRSTEPADANRSSSGCARAPPRLIPDHLWSDHACTLESAHAHESLSLK